MPVTWVERHLDHGYAMTCHKAQGATFDTALLYGASLLTREAGYVALSRGRTANHIYVPDAAEDDTATTFDRDQHLDLLAAHLAIRRTQTLATRQLPREPGRWSPSNTHSAQHRHAEGISR